MFFFSLLRIYFLFAIPTLAAVYQVLITLRNHQTEVGQKSLVKISFQVILTETVVAEVTGVFLLSLANDSTVTGTFKLERQSSLQQLVWVEIIPMSLTVFNVLEFNNAIKAE